MGKALPGRNGAQTTHRHRSVTWLSFVPLIRLHLALSVFCISFCGFQLACVAAYHVITTCTYLSALPGPYSACSRCSVIPASPACLATECTQIETLQSLLQGRPRSNRRWWWSCGRSWWKRGRSWGSSGAGPPGSCVRLWNPASQTWPCGAADLTCASAGRLLQRYMNCLFLFNTPCPCFAPLSHVSDAAHSRLVTDNHSSVTDACLL